MFCIPVIKNQNVLFQRDLQVLSKRNPDFDPSAVLDFLMTCVYLQKQWQCRDKHVPKHDSGLQDVLELSEHQVNISDYFLVINHSTVLRQNNFIFLV